MTAGDVRGLRPGLAVGPMTSWSVLDLSQTPRIGFGALFPPMVPLTYRCPETGQQVQGWAADDLIGWDSYEPVTCTACGRVHLVNPKSGKVLESEKQ
jgi:hypothetical protein